MVTPLLRGSEPVRGAGTHSQTRRTSRGVEDIPGEASASARARRPGQSDRGPRRRVRSHPAPEKITVLDVVQAVDGTEPAFRCTEIRQQGILAAPPEQCRSACGIANVMADAEKAWRASLSGVTIADLAATLDLPALRKILTTPITP